VIGGIAVVGSNDRLARCAALGFLQNAVGAIARPSTASSSCAA
jgi:hypothetical protein